MAAYVVTLQRTVVQRQRRWVDADDPESARLKALETAVGDDVDYADDTWSTIASTGDTVAVGAEAHEPSAYGRMSLEQFDDALKQITTAEVLRKQFDAPSVLLTNVKR